MSQLTESYERWQRQPFPPGSLSDAVDELHADLAGADAWVAESVIPFVEDGIHDPARFDVIAELDALRRRASDLATAVASDERGPVNEYVAYLDLLADVYEDFLASAPRGA